MEMKTQKMSTHFILTHREMEHLLWASHGITQEENSQPT